MSILLFNLFGYRFALNYLQSRADYQLQAHIDLDNYDESQLLELRVPLNMPYQAQSSAFERHYGEIEIAGKHYTYVKRKIEEGVLVLKCIANIQKDKLEFAGKAAIAANNNLDQQQGAAPAPHAKVIKNFTPDFDNDKYNLQLDIQIPQEIQYGILASSFIQTDFTTICEQPPDCISLI